MIVLLCKPGQYIYYYDEPACGIKIIVRNPEAGKYVVILLCAVNY